MPRQSVKKQEGNTSRKTAPRKTVRTRSKIVVRSEKKISPIKLSKPEANPIISPSAENSWEAWQTFNPGAALIKDKVHFLYRAIGDDGISRFGYASSENGLVISERLHYPVYEHILTNKRVFNPYSFASGGSFGGSEDPRITNMENEGVLYVTYTACDDGLGVALTHISEEDMLNKRWRWSPPVLISPPGETHKNWVIFPEKINGRYAILHSITPKILIEYRDTLEFKDDDYIRSRHDGTNGEKKRWESWIRGAGAPPIKTKEGWLLFYHAMDKNDPGKYKVGAILLDLNDPSKILYRSPEPVLEPEKEYENNGFKAGIVYVSGAVIKDGKLFVYYGAADNYVSVAYANLETFLSELMKGEKPAFKTGKAKKK